MMDRIPNPFDALTKGVSVMADNLGWSMLHMLSPDNFSYYCCSLELIENGDTIGFLSFPVMPNNISETKNEAVNVVKTVGGVVSNYNTSFVPRDINIQGTFGRKIRLLTGAKEAKKTFVAGAIPLGFGWKINGTEVMVKGGYGLTKMLKNMIDMSYESGKHPRFLVFRNYAFNTAYVVEVLQSSFTQSVENNTLWFYSLNMKAVAYADSLSKQSNAKFLLRSNLPSVGKGIDKFLREATRFDLSSMWG